MNDPSIIPIPTAARKARGWVPVLEFPNGGRQVFASLYWTSTAATNAARSAAAIRARYPHRTAPDPAPNKLQNL